MTQILTITDLERALGEAGGTSDEATIKHVDLLNALAWELSDSDAGRAGALAEMAYALTENLPESAHPYRRGMAYSLRTLGYLDMRFGAYPRGMNRLLQAQTLFEALREAGSPPGDVGLVDVFDGIASIYGQMGDFAECLTYSYKMLACAEHSGDRRRIANARNNLAFVYGNTGEYVRAIAILEQNVREATASGYQRIEVLSHINLADLYLQSGDAPKALEHGLSGLRGAREAAFAIFEGYALEYLGKSHMQLGDSSAALDALEQALALSRRIGSRVTEAIHLLTLGQMYAVIGQPEQALAYLQECVAIAQALEAKAELFAAHRAIAELYEQQGDTSQALAHFKQYHALHAQITGQQINQRLKVLQIVHATETAYKETHALQQAAEALHQANAELARAVRTKDEFLATMSHELRTPLNAILSFSETLQEQIYGPLNPDQHEALRRIETGGRHLLTLINDILDLAKVEAGRLELYAEWVEVKVICQISLMFVREQAVKKGLSLDTQLNDQHAMIEVDVKRLKQILVNLLANAVKFTPEGGAVTLKVTLDAEAGVARFAVTDTGIGIAPADLGQLFQPFSQLDAALNREREGTGLGLMLVRRLADLHGGSVTVASELGKGSCFTVALPYRHFADKPIATADGSTTVAGGEPPLLVSSTRRGRLLLAEDNEANRRALDDYLRASGYEVVLARDGQEALKLAEVVQPQLILMDIQMPRIDGLEAIRRLRAQPAQVATPIITLTALAMPGDEARCLAAGATVYMIKPIKLRKLVETIAQLLDARGIV
jgi:signal transduction histidine kinase/ActR/RegA family two-component response regulator